MDSQLTKYISGQIWLKEYPVRYAGTRFNARMAVIRLSNSLLMLHSPCEIDDTLKREIDAIGKVGYIVAPGSFHFTHIASAQDAFGDAETFICSGIERKLPGLQFDWILGDRPDLRWAADLEQVLVRGSRYIWEIAFYHKSSKTLILVDLLENFTNSTPDVSWTLKFWWKVVFYMWNHPKPAPEYQLGWKDKAAAKKSLERIMEWDFERIIIAHGDLVESNAKETLLDAWKRPLQSM